MRKMLNGKFVAGFSQETGIKYLHLQIIVLLNYEYLQMEGLLYESNRNCT